MYIAPVHRLGPGLGLGLDLARGVEKIVVHEETTLSTGDTDTDTDGEAETETETRK